MRLKQFIESNRFDWFITVLIAINAIVLGLETVPEVATRFGSTLRAIDFFLLLIFTVELISRFIVYRQRFFHDPWRCFDFVIITISWIPTSGGLSVLRALRALRILRLVSVVPSLRRVVGGLISALPGMGSITVLMFLVFYVFAVMATNLFGQAFPEWFGNLGASAYTLFQIMTLESWSMGIVRPVMTEFPLAWAFFLPFILCTTFTVLNLFIGVIVAAMQAADEHSADTETVQSESTESTDDRLGQLLNELQALRSEVRELRARKP